MSVSLVALRCAAVDGLSCECRLIGAIVKKYPTEMSPILDKWIADPDMWMRRIALIHQLDFKRDTNHERLFQYCRMTMHENEFFIRKAIGWVLRQYARTDADAVRAFVHENREHLSGLSRREALKHIE
jgi:3-methyladenine DNA glycosylase AlkD